MMKTYRKLCLCVLALSGLLPFAQAQDDPNEYSEQYLKNKATVDALHQKHLEQFSENPRYWAQPGLLADRKEKTVTVWAELNSLEEGAPVEFILISERSAHDYEAVLSSFARAGDIHKALEFIGMTSGLSMDSRVLRFWPKGERVLVHAAWGDQKIRAEQLIRDTRTEKTLPEEGWVFTGAGWVEDSDKPGEKVYQADLYDPGSILSVYNETASVLDVPRMDSKGSVYGFLLMKSHEGLNPGMLLKLTFEPEFKDDQKRVRDYELVIRPDEKTPGQDLKHMRFELHEGDTTKTFNKTAELLAHFGKVTEGQVDPFVSIKPGDALPLTGVQKVYAFLQAIEGVNGIRIEPPPEGHPYYKSFTPNEAFRDRDNRPSQPWELHLSMKDEKVEAVMKNIKKVYPEEGDPFYEVTDVPVATPEALAKALRDSENLLRVLLVFAPGDMKYGVLKTFLKPALDTHSTVFVFLD